MWNQSVHHARVQQEQKKSCSWLLRAKRSHDWIPSAHTSVQALSLIPLLLFPLPPSRHNTDKEVWATPRPPSRYLSLRSLWAASCPSLEIPVSRRSSLVWSRNKSAVRKMSLKCVCCLRALLLKLLYECAPLSGITVRFSSYCFGMLAAPLRALNMRWTCEDQILYLAFFVYLYSLLFSSSFFLGEAEGRTLCMEIRSLNAEDLTWKVIKAALIDIFYSNKQANECVKCERYHSSGQEHGGFSPTCAFSLAA